MDYKDNKELEILDTIYTAGSLLKENKFGITELVNGMDGKRYIRKILSYPEKAYEILKEKSVNGIPKIYWAVVGANPGYIFKDKSQETCPKTITYVIEEFIGGETLQSLIHKGRRFSEEEVESIALQLTDILTELHSIGIIHRDIKEANIMLLEDGATIRLIDLGAARVYTKDNQNTDTTILGTPGYAPPEQYGFAPTDTRSDIFALGRTMANMLGDDYNGYLAPVIKACVEIDPKNRVDSATRLKQMLLNPGDKLLYIKSKAANGNTDSMVSLGRMYLEGMYIEQDAEQGNKLLRKASEAGNGAGTYYLARSYENGIGVQIDLLTAKKLYLEAISQQNACASVALGWLYYYGRGVEINYPMAIRLFKDGINSADKLAHNEGLFAMARCYYSGLGVAKDINKAITIFKELDAEGFCAGALGMAFCYEDGCGVEKDLKEAFKWYKKAADNNSTFARASVGKCYYYGLGVAKDYIMAAKYLKMAAAEGNATAMGYLACMYIYEDGVEQDYQKAYDLAVKGAERWDNISCFLLANVFYMRGLIVKRDYKKVFYWAKQAADRGYPPALHRVAFCYTYGMGTDKNYIKAEETYSAAIAKGNIASLTGLGYLNLKGLGMDINYQKAYELFMKAAEQGEADAMYRLGNMYTAGQGVEQDLEQALVWYKKAADHEHKWALVKIGYCYYKGICYKQDINKAIDIFQYAADRNDYRANYYLGEIYLDGIGVEKDKEKAIVHFQKAAEWHEERAMAKLEELK